MMPTTWFGRAALSGLMCVVLTDAAINHKRGKKVSWKRLDCQDELHRSVTDNKFTTLTPRKEEQEFDEMLTIRMDYSSPGDMCQKKGKHE